MAVIKEMIRAIIECMDDLEIRIDDMYRTLEEQDRGYFLWLIQDVIFHAKCEKELENHKKFHFEDYISPYEQFLMDSCEYLQIHQLVRDLQSELRFHDLKTIKQFERKVLNY